MALGNKAKRFTDDDLDKIKTLADNTSQLIGPDAAQSVKDLATQIGSLRDQMETWRMNRKIGTKIGMNEHGGIGEATGLQALNFGGGGVLGGMIGEGLAGAHGMIGGGLAGATLMGAAKSPAVKYGLNAGLDYAGNHLVFPIADIAQHGLVPQSNNQ